MARGRRGRGRHVRRAAPEWLVERMVAWLPSRARPRSRSSASTEDTNAASLATSVRRTAERERHRSRRSVDLGEPGVQERARTRRSSSAIPSSGPTRDHPVAGLEDERAARPVDPPSARAGRRGRTSRSPSRTRAPSARGPSAGEPASRRSRRVSSSLERDAATTGWSGSPCSTYQVMSRAASKIDSLAFARRRSPRSSSGFAGLGRRAEDPRLELVLQDVAPGLERADLGRERAVVEQQRRVREAHGRLGQVLHLDEDVDRPVELGERRRVVFGGFGAAGRAGELAEERSRPPRARGRAARRPRLITSSGPGSNCQSMPLRIAMTHIPVSVGSERSRRRPADHRRAARGP